MTIDAAGAAAGPSPPGEGPVIRVVTDGAPWPGTIVREHDGTTTLHVDAALLAETTVWCAAPDGHLLAPLDVMRTGDGHEAVFPLCQRRLDDVLRERIEAGAPPSAGECVTVAVSVLRGTAEAAESAAGSWWLTEDGRPVLAIGRGEGVRDAALGILAVLAEVSTGPVGAALHAASEAVADPRGDLAAAEDTLFTVAEPAPLVTTVLAPARARSVASALREEPVPRRSAMRAAVARHVDTDVADRVLGARDELRERCAARRARRAERRARERSGALSPPRPVRPPGDAGRGDTAVRRRVGRAPLVAGAAVAAIVLGAGLMWPSEDPSSTGTSPTAPSPTDAASVPPAQQPLAAEPGTAPTPATDAEGPADPQAVADQLLTAAASCADEPCRDALRETPGRPGVDGVLGLAGPEREIVLVEDYGGVAVLRVSAVAADTVPDRLLVIVETAQKWLIRDAYDVADQP